LRLCARKYQLIFMLDHNLQQKLHYTLRFAAALCFIGHGAFGIITKEIWCNYFAVFGIDKANAYHLMPWVGSFDIICGIAMLVYPMRIVPIWLVVWGLITAFLRPMSGEPFGEFIERAGNYGAPFCLLLLSGGVQMNVKSWFTPIDPNAEIKTDILPKVILALRVIVFLLLAGHGWLNLIGKKGLMGQYASLGITNAASTAHIIGALEIAAGLIVLIKPVRQIVLVFLIWKITSELFYPHWEVFEWIERGGSYGCILALWFALGQKSEVVSREAVISH